MKHVFLKSGILLASRLALASCAVSAEGNHAASNRDLSLNPTSNLSATVGKRTTDLHDAVETAVFSSIEADTAISLDIDPSQQYQVFTPEEKQELIRLRSQDPAYPLFPLSSG